MLRWCSGDAQVMLRWCSGDAQVMLLSWESTKRAHQTWCCLCRARKGYVCPIGSWGVWWLGKVVSLSGWQPSLLAWTTMVPYTVVWALKLMCHNARALLARSRSIIWHWGYWTWLYYVIVLIIIINYSFQNYIYFKYQQRVLKGLSASSHNCSGGVQYTCNW